MFRLAESRPTNILPISDTYFIHTGPSIYPWVGIETFELGYDDFNLIQKVLASSLRHANPACAYRLSLRKGSSISGHSLCFQACLISPPKEELKEVSFIQHNLKRVGCPYLAIAMIAAGFRGEHYA